MREDEHHPLVQHVLGAESQLRAELVKFLRGGSLEHPQRLPTLLAKLRAMPIVERSIEAKHSFMNKNLVHNVRPTPASVSMALRFGEITP